MDWMISANSKLYDHSSSFEHYNFIDWRQGNYKYNKGDTIYIYCTRPFMQIRYKCLVEKINLSFDSIRNDKEYWFDKEEYEKSLDGKYMRLKLIEQLSSNRLNLHN